MLDQRKSDIWNALGIGSQWIERDELAKAAEEAAKILTEGKSSELQGFVSNRTKRNFSAYLVLGKDGTVGFEFAQQKSKTSRRKTTAKK